MTPVSPDPTTYVNQMAALLDLQLTPEVEAAVVDNWVTLTKVAELVLDFPLPDEIESAPIFQP